MQNVEMCNGDYINAVGDAICVDCATDLGYGMED